MPSVHYLPSHIFDLELRFRAALPFLPSLVVVKQRTEKHLSLGAPHVLQQTIALGQAVHGVIGLSHGTNESTQSVDVVLSGDSAAALVNLGDRNLDRTVVLGLDDAVGGRALAGDVATKEMSC